MNVKINSFLTAEDVIRALAMHIRDIARDSIESQGRFDFVLSGGNSPRRLYEFMASDEFRHEIDWRQTYFFFGDERFVPSDDDRRNSLMAAESLLIPLNIPNDHIFAIDTSGTPERAAREYTARVKKHFDDGPIQFDMILLGLGSDGHTASLFPSTPVLKETEANFRQVHLIDQNMFRITMTAPLINRARNVAFLVYGKDKAHAVQAVLDGSLDTSDHYPARLIHPKSGNLQWFLDSEAASLLSEGSVHAT